MVRLRTGRFAFGTVAVLLALGCSGSDGDAGVIGSDGAPGAPGGGGDAGAAGERGRAGSPGPTALTSSVDERPGPHCISGGTALRFGVDANSNDVLDEGEVSGTFYVCNGSPGGAQLSDVPVGDPRCPHGGIAVLLDGKDEGVACHGAPGNIGEAGAKGVTGESGVAGAPGVTGATGATGSAGATGAAGAKGESGDLGAAGPAGAAGPTGTKGDAGDPGAAGTKGTPGDPGSPAPAQTVLGVFVSSQIVRGAVVTCVTTDTQSASTRCLGLSINGLPMRLSTTDANAMCAAVTGKSYMTANGGGTTSPAILWNSGWTLTTNAVVPATNVTCNR